MVTKKKRTGTAAKKGRVKVENLKLNKETVNLSEGERKQIKGGRTLNYIAPRYPTP